MTRHITLEHAIQKAIMDGLKWRRIPAYRLNSGAYKPREGSFIRFGFAGCPDIIVLLRGTIGCIEVKSARGKLSPAQVEFRRQCEDRNIPYCLAYSWEDVNIWLNGNKL